MDATLPVVPSVAAGSTTLLADDRDPPCLAGAGGRDAGHELVAPADGFYVFDTTGTAWDTVVYVHASDCDGPVLGCNDDVALGNIASRVSVYLPQDQTAVAVVDGWDATQHGAYTLAVDAIFDTCVDTDVGQVTNAVVTADTSAEVDKLTPSCLPHSGPDYIVRWVVPGDNLFRLRTTGSTFDTVLHVYAGECSGVPIACNDDANPLDLTSSITFAPGMGTVLTIVVDGFDAAAYGPFTLTIEPL